MWLPGGLLITAAEAPEANNSLIVVVGGIIVAAMAPLGYVLVEIIKGRNSRNATITAPPPLPTVTVDDRVLGQVAVLWQWRKEIREADNIHDRTLFEVVDDVKDITNWMDREHPGWRP